MQYQESAKMNEFIELVRLGLAYNPETGNYFFIHFDYPEDSWEWFENKESEGGVWTPSEVHAIDCLISNILRLIPQEEGDEVCEMASGLHFNKRPDGSWTFTYNKQLFSPKQCEVLSRIENLTK